MMFITMKRFSLIAVLLLTPLASLQAAEACAARPPTHG